MHHSQPKPEKRLLEAIATQIQTHKPDQVPTPESSVPTRPPPKTTPTKGQPSFPVQRKAFKAPQAPQPWPKLQDRVSPYSPMIDAGIYVDAVSNALAAEKKGAESVAGAAPGQQQAQAGGGKGKKKVIRVRG
ncbi:hypothetical protein FRC12_022615 [Ceratobasidium sp. 428]|nr:hypothetical protein FRC12_022615 [Ceratobasidium sp. 428]